MLEIYIVGAVLTAVVVLCIFTWRAVREDDPAQALGGAVIAMLAVIWPILWAIAILYALFYVIQNR